MSVSYDVLLTGARAYVAHTRIPADADPEVLARDLITHGAAVRAAIVAAVEADRRTPVPSGPSDGIPAQRVPVAHADR